MEAIHTVLYDSQGLFGLSRDVTIGLTTVLLINITIPLVWGAVSGWLNARRWRPLRQHLAVMIGYHHSELRSLISKALAAIGDGTKVTNIGGIDPKMERLQSEIGLYGFAMNATTARKIGSYLEAMNDVWFAAYYSASHVKFNRRLCTLSELEEMCIDLVSNLKLPKEYHERFFPTCK